MTTAIAWNHKYPVGTKVRWLAPAPPVGPNAMQNAASTGIDTVTRTEAFHLSGGTAVVLLQHVAGAKPLAEIEVLEVALTEEGIF